MTQATFSADTNGRPARRPEYALDPDIFLLDAPDGSARLCDLDGNFYGVTATGALMLRATLERGPAAAAEKVAARFGVDAPGVRKDLDAFLHQLQQQGLLRGPASPRRRRPGTAWPFLALAPAIGLVRRGCRSLKARAWGLLFLARLSLRLFGLRRTLALWQRCFPLAPPPGPTSAATVKRLDEAVRDATATYLFRATCKERSLCSWALCRSAGVPAALVVGVNLFPLASHCWCEVGSLILADSPEWVEQFTPALRYE